MELEYKMTLGMFINHHRKKLGLKLEDLEEPTRLSTGSLSLIENDKRMIDENLATRIFTALKFNDDMIIEALIEFNIPQYVMKKKQRRQEKSENKNVTTITYERKEVITVDENNSINAEQYCSNCQYHMALKDEKVCKRYETYTSLCMSKCKLLKPFFLSGVK